MEIFTEKKLSSRFCVFRLMCKSFVLHPEKYVLILFGTLVLALFSGHAIPSGAADGRFPVAPKPPADNRGSDANLSADAFARSGPYLYLLATVSGLPQDVDPVHKLKGIISANKNYEHKDRVMRCAKMARNKPVELPEVNVPVSLNQIKNICIAYELPDLWAQIEKNPPPNPFQSDGCSLWFNSWKGVNLYPACFLHDLKYWAGFPDEEVERLIADAELMIDIACLTGSTTMAETMFQGTRLGGDELYQRPFSWGFGRK